jgi:hypothetical protein
MRARKKSATIQLKVRMKEPLRATLEKAAAQRGVSLNSEIVDRLEQSHEIQNVLDWLFQEKIVPEEVLALKACWPALRRAVAKGAGNHTATGWCEYLNALLPALEGMDKVVEEEFVRRVRDDLIANGEPRQAEFHKLVPGKPSRATTEADRRWNIDWALKILERRPELRAGEFELWGAAEDALAALKISDHDS